MYNFILLFLKRVYSFKIFKRIVPSLLRKFGGLKIINIYNFQLYASLSDSIEREIFLTNHYDKDRLDFLEKYLTKYNFEYFFDIGSYIGFYSLFFHHKKCIPKVFAFEPNNKNFNKLIKNIKLNESNIKTYNIALSNNKGEGKIWFNNSNKTGGSSILNPSDNEIKKYEKSKILYENVKLDTLDSIFYNIIGKKIFIKIDVERHELNVLQGSIKLIKNNDILLQIEILEEQKKIVFDHLKRNNFIHHHTIDDDHFFSNFITT